MPNIESCFTEREGFILDLKNRVDRAFRNRLKVKLTPEGLDLADNIENAKVLKKRFKYLLDNASILIDPVMEGPNEVMISNSHDYKDLVQFAAEKIAEYYDYPRQKIKGIVADVLEHEYQHHVPALDQDLLQVRYKIYFVEDEKTGRIGFGASLPLSGITKAGIFRDISTAVTKPSQSDLAFYS